MGFRKFFWKCRRCGHPFGGAQEDYLCPSCREDLAERQRKSHEKEARRLKLLPNELRARAWESLGSLAQATQAEVAEIFGCKKQYIQHLERSAIVKLRENKELAHLYEQILHKGLDRPDPNPPAEDLEAYVWQVELWSFLSDLIAPECPEEAEEMRLEVKRFREQLRHGNGNGNGTSNMNLEINKDQKRQELLEVSKLIFANELRIDRTATFTDAAERATQAALILIERVNETVMRGNGSAKKAR
jgi:hypothetical protein